MKSKKVSTTFTVLSMAAGMFLTPASAYAEPLASGQETVVDSSDVSTDDSVSEKQILILAHLKHRKSQKTRHLILLRNQRKKMTQKIRHLRNQMLPHLSPHPLLRLQSLPKLQHQTHQPLRLSQKLILNPLKKMQIPVLHPQKTQIPLPIMRQKRLQ